jgi:hypothetical protein
MQFAAELSTEIIGDLLRFQHGGQFDKDESRQESTVRIQQKVRLRKKALLIEVDNTNKTIHDDIIGLILLCRFGVWTGIPAIIRCKLRQDTVNSKE